MKISIIVPFWNSEQWLGRCCESLMQLKGDYEFWLVDDHSTDNGREIAYEYCFKDQRFILTTNHRTKGVSGARNTGIDLADGEYITFLDADDEMLPEADASFSLALQTDANIHQINHLRYYANIDALRLKYWNREGWYDIRHLPEHWFGVWNKLYRREFVGDTRFKEGLQYGEDGLFILELLAKGSRIHHTDKLIVAVKHRFDNRESLSHIKTAEDIYKQLQAYEEFWHEQTDSDVRIAVALEIANLWKTRMIKAI